jgi:hypothetical protein
MKVEFRNIQIVDWRSKGARVLPISIEFFGLTLRYRTTASPDDPKRCNAAMITRLNIA